MLFPLIKRKSPSGPMPAGVMSRCDGMPWGVDGRDPEGGWGGVEGAQPAELKLGEGTLSGLHPFLFQFHF